MEELRFIIKCFVFTSLLVILTQVKVGNHSIEAYTFHWLRKSPASQYIQSAAAGGAMAMRNLAFGAKDAVASTVEGFQEGAHEKAVR